MSKRSKGITAEEFLRTLEADPEYVRRRAEQDAELARLDALYRDAEAPLVSELARLGVHVWTVWDLVNGPNSYEVAIPLLLDHLRRPYPDAISAGIARALGVPATRSLGWNVLVEEYRRNQALESRLKEGLACALSGAADDSVIDDVIELARDKQNGNSRVLLLQAIRKSKRPEASKPLSNWLAISNWHLRLAHGADDRRPDKHSGSDHRLTGN